MSKGTEKTASSKARRDNSRRRPQKRLQEFPYLTGDHSATATIDVLKDIGKFDLRSTDRGGSAVGPNGRLIHSAHRHGANIDLRYMAASGTSLVGATAAASGDPERNLFIMTQFADQGANLGASLTGDPARFGFGPISRSLQQAHVTHMHFQQTYPSRQEPRIVPGRR